LQSEVVEDRADLAGREAPRHARTVPDGGPGTQRGDGWSIGQESDRPPGDAFENYEFTPSGRLGKRDKLRHRDGIRPGVVVIATITDAEVEVAGSREPRVQEDGVVVRRVIRRQGAHEEVLRIVGQVKGPEWARAEGELI